ncbi:kinesin-like protein KIF18B isoform X1 [Mycteria americana]|uniref:kinesin-like protein KIF18B isoform X1 n=1 Tax=Mycteria americana TaxID=33587 RepID=UPI003F589C84
MRPPGHSSPEPCPPASTVPPSQLPPAPMALGPPPEEGTVAVMVRVRPPAPCERERAAHPVLHVVDQHVLVFDPEGPGGPPGSVLPARGPKHQGKDLKFVFDRVFGEGATQEEVFQHTTHEVLDSVLNGYNCSVFAYGATGAGKTYTMLGSEKSPGIMYLTMVELYKRIEARKEEKSCEVLVSYQEVYNEQIHDLLEPKGPLAIREDPEKGVVVQGLSFHQPTSAEQLLEMLANGNKNRTQHPTDANATSSRSHAIFQIYVKQQDRVGSLARDLQVAKMSLIDLAGSERASVTNTKGERLREGANINRSLLALINVINALADAKSKKTHIPYRDSKLTRLLKDSIGGNCRTIMIAAVSPSGLAYEDTYNTLKYANRAKEIKLSLKSNVLSFDCHVSKYAVVCEQLKAEVADLRAKLRAYEDAAREAENRAPALLAPLTSSPAGLPRVEEAVPKTCLALDDQRESNGGQQELEAGQPVQLQLESEEEAPEETPPSSPRATHQTDVQLEPKKPSHLLQGLSGSQRETLVAAILSVARKQYSLLKAANLLTPDMVAEFEELERLAHQEAGVSLEQATAPNGPAEVSAAAPAQRMQQGCDAEASVAVPSAPVTSATLQCLQQLAPLSSPTPLAPSPIKKRRRSEMNSASQLGTPRSLKTRMKRQRRGGKAAETPRATQSPGTPCLRAAAQAPPVSPVPSCCIPKICPLTVTKSRVPLAMSAAQNRCGLPAPPTHDMNVTFEVCEDSGSPGAAKPAAFSVPEFPVWENVQSLLNKQDGHFVPKACVPVFAMKASSIPKPSSASKAPAQKRRRVESTSSPSLGGLQSSSQKSVQPSRIPAHPSGALAWKGRKRTTKELEALGRAPPTPTPQPMKLLC